jgi:hypothetical protein
MYGGYYYETLNKTLITSLSKWRRVLEELSGPQVVKKFLTSDAV